MIVYKLTTQDNKTRAGLYNECIWGPGVTHKGTGLGELCSGGYIHAYLSPELAVLLNPIHAAITDPKLWECSVDQIDKNDRNLKVGSVSLTTLRQIPLPVITQRQKVIFSILCLEAVHESMTEKYSGKSWWSRYVTELQPYIKWAEAYKRGTATAADADRAADAAYAAAYAAYTADAVYAADVAGRAADAAYTAYAAGRAAYTADRAADAVYAAGRAAYTADRAADAVYAAGVVCLDLVSIANKALTFR